MSFDEYCFDDNCHWDDKLTKFFACEILVRVSLYVIRKTQIDVDLAQTKHVSDVLSRDVLQSFSSLKSDDFVDYVQNEVIFNTHNVDDDWIIEIDLIF
jgi:hypothetical protein